MNLILAAFAVSFALASFFWLRGIWKNEKSDLIAACLFLFCLFLMFAMGLGALNEAGLCIMVLGTATIVVGRAGKRIPSNQTDACGAMLLLFGLFLSLLL
jgi:hypothetical protein